MNNRFAAIEQVISADPGGRGIAALVEAGDLEAAAQSLRTARQVGIVTGFYIQRAHACETDGPPGAVALGMALAQLGSVVHYVTDPACAPVPQGAGMQPLAVLDSSRLVPFVESMPFTHLVAIERAGLAVDGRCYNMRGHDISPWTVPLDALFTPMPRGRWTTIGIGDGGNEIGMGKCRDRVVESIAHGATIGCVTATDFLIVAGTSNWGAWGLIAGLSLLARQNLLPSPEQALAQLNAAIAAGAVDGVTGRSEPTVDGLDWPIHLSILQQLHTIIDT